MVRLWETRCDVAILVAGQPGSGKSAAFLSHFPEAVIEITAEEQIGSCKLLKGRVYVEDSEVCPSLKKE